MMKNQGKSGDFIGKVREFHPENHFENPVLGRTREQDVEKGCFVYFGF